MIQEIWRPVSGYNGVYWVSSQGRVKSVKNGKEKVLSQRTDKDGYKEVTLSKDGHRKHHKVHRLVAYEFIPNDDLFKREVNHKDEDPSNNSVSNLEWCDRAYNNRYGRRNERMAEANSIPIWQIMPDVGKLRLWKSAKEVERTIGLGASFIAKCCKKKRESCYGFIWRYA